MKKQIISSILLSVLVTLGAMAESLTIEPGTLAQSIQNPSEVTELELAGRANAADFKFMATEMPELVSLDLSGLLAIDAVNDVFFANITRHPAGKIPTNTFAGSKLSSVTLPSFKNLNIGDGAFAGTKLSAVNIPATTTLLGAGAFAGCDELVSVVCGAANIGHGAFADCPKLATVSFTAPVEIPVACFMNDAALKTVSGTVQSVGNRAFIGCSSLESFPFTASLHMIGREAFLGAGLTEINLTETAVDSIGEWAFAKMPALKSVKIAPSTGMGRAVAFACPQLAAFAFASDAEELPDFALAKTGVSDTIGLIPEQVRRIGQYAFSGLSGIKSLTLPTTLEYIGDHAMENMTGLEHITAEINNVPELGEDVWAGVDQGSVELRVPNEMFDAFNNADQWQNFSIVKTSSSIDAVVTEELSQLRARFDGDDLIVDIADVEIDRLMLFNPAGQLLIAVEPSDSTVVIDTFGFGTRLFIVNAALSDGRVASLKIAKR